MTGIVEYRDVRAGGAVIASWVGPEYLEHGPFYGAEWPEPPWSRQRRVPGGEWVTVEEYGTDGLVRVLWPHVLTTEWRLP